MPHKFFTCLAFFEFYCKTQAKHPSLSLFFPLSKGRNNNREELSYGCIISSGIIRTDFTSGNCFAVASISIRSTPTLHDPPEALDWGS